MIKKKTIMIISVVLLVSAVLYQVAIMTYSKGWDDIFKILSIVPLFLGTSGSILSIFIPSSSYVCFISHDDWLNEGKTWYYPIPKKRHGCGKHPRIDTYIKGPDGSYGAAVFNIEINNKGDIVLGAGVPVDEEVKAIITD